jgi:hypothetical protein
LKRCRTNVSIRRLPWMLACEHEVGKLHHGSGPVYTGHRLWLGHAAEIPIDVDHEGLRVFYPVGMHCAFGPRIETDRDFRRLNPSGVRKLASQHPHGYFNDESAQQPAWKETVNIVRPAVKQIINVSSGGTRRLCG